MKSADVTSRFIDSPCPPENAFRFANGARAASLAEFRAALSAAPLDVVAFHRTHFRYWLADVIADAPLAERAKQLGESDMPAMGLRDTLLHLIDARLVELRSPRHESARPVQRRKLFG